MGFFPLKQAARGFRRQSPLLSGALPCIDRRTGEEKIFAMADLVFSISAPVQKWCKPKTLNRKNP